MARKKNLERAVVLGLILSTGVYGNAWATNVPAISNSSRDYDVKDNVIVEANTTSDTEDGIGNIILRDEGQYTVSIKTTGGNIEFEKNNGTGILLADRIATGTKVALNASGDIIINAKNGIQGNASARDENNVSTITLNAQNNRITATETAVYGLGKVDIELTADKDNVIVTTGNDYAVKTDANSAGILNITAQDGNNIIMAEKGTAIRANGNKVITIKANNKDNEENGNNIIIGGENGIQHNEEGKDADGQTIVKDANTKYVIIDGKNNVVYGGENGILSDGTGIVKVTANESNTIGQYSDESNVTHTSNTGINVTEGTVDIDANTGNNVIYAKNIGIDVSKGKADLDAFGNNIINVNSKNLDVSGILVENYGQAEITSANAGIEINVTATKSGPANYKAYAIKAIKNGSVNLDAKGNISIKLNVNDDSLNANQNGKITSALTAEEKSNAKVEADGFLYLESKGNKIGFQGNQEVKNFGIQAEDGSTVDITVNGKNENGYGAVIKTEGRYSTAISSEDSSTELKLTDGGLYIDNTAQDDAYSVRNLASDDESTVEISANGDIYLGSTNNSPVETGYYTGGAYVKGIVNESNDVNDASTIVSADTVIIESIANGENNSLQAYGIQANNTGTGNNLIDIDSENLSITAKVDRKNKVNYAYGINSQNSTIDVDITSSTYIESSRYGIYARNYYTQNNTETNIDIDSGLSNTITATNTGIYSNGLNTTVKLNAKQNTINANTGIWGLNNGKVSLGASTLTNEITADAYGIYADTQSDIDLNAGNSNNILAAKTTITDKETGNSVDYGQQSAVHALSGSSVDLAAGEQNYLLGAVYANGSGTNVDVKGKNGSTATNVVRSAAVIDGAGGLDGKVTTTDPETGEIVTTGLDVVSALYAEKGAVINVSGINDFRTYYSDPSDEYTSERVVWAYDTADINIDGYTNISTTLYNESPNSKDIAIAAGTATKLTAGEVNAPVADRATVTLNYDNFTTNDGKQAVSEITGDILSAYAGQVDIEGKSADAGIKITGNLLAGNNGILNVNLGKGGVLTGRADDYGDAGANPSGVGDGNDGHQSSEFFDPAFSSEIFKGGEVNLTMGENSRWNVTGQSWITRINTAENSNAIIDLVGSNTDRNTTAHALTVYEMNGDANFNMSLDADRDVSDMLYIKNAKGNYVVNVIDAVTEDDMYAARTDGGTFDGLRFATVGKDSTASFRAITYDDGFNNVEYIIGSDSYDESTENHHYNGDSLDAEKPGDSTVDDFFENDGTPGSTTGATNGLAKASLMALPVNETNNAENDDLTNVEVNTDETTNFKLIGVKNTEVSDGGETILNMSRANYSNAIYMDRLNKRLGEARYINSEEDEGMWVRIRHDRIGKDDAYRSQNTMYELGYDQKQECDNGERRVGMAIDYMHGDTGYNDIAGKGEIDRYGLWLYDTWMGDKGHYADYVAKWGHLSNDFEIYNSRGEVTGDYNNNVFSVSAEYGRKKDIGNDWYFEPQIQAQLARVTGADYTTNQGTKVSVDGINSLIGRAGFRLGKDFGEEKQSTVYIKADVLHEFLGDQDIRALDSTTNGNWQTVSYENEGTWYDVGFGFATQMSKNSYAFMDFEKSFGNDNDETYQINVGMQWSF